MHVERTAHALFFMLIWALFSVASAATNAGSQIINKATLRYIDSFSGDIVEVESNTSTITVSTIKRFELTAPQSVTAKAADTVNFPHLLTNTGNIEDSYSVQVEHSLADNHDLENLQLTLDVNANGEVDPGENLVTSALILAAGESVNLLVSGAVPAFVDPGDTIDILLHAVSADTAISPQLNRDLITIADVAELELTLSSAIPGSSELASCDAIILPGERFDSLVNIRNSGGALADEVSVLVDGELRQGVLMQFAIPAGLQLVQDEALNIAAFQAIALVRESASQSGWMRYGQWSGNTTLTDLAVLIPADSLANGEDASIEFGLIAMAGVADRTEFRLAASIDLDLDGTVDVISNQNCYSVLAPAAAVSAEIRFIEASIAQQISNQSPAFSQDQSFIDTTAYRLTATDPLQAAGAEELSAARYGAYIELQGSISDSAVLQAVDGIRHVSVIVNSQVTGDSINLVLRETGSDTNLYRSTEPLYLSESQRSDNAWCPEDIGLAVSQDPDYANSDTICVLQSTDDDVLTVSFVDPERRTDLIDTAVVNPSSRVFDSTTLAGIAGAQITIYANGETARHPVTDLPLVLISDKAGRYFLPRLTEGINYSLGVDPPDTHQFPSLVPPDQLSSENISSASYGQTGYQATGNGRFVVSVDNPIPTIDIPLDPLNRASLLQVEKFASTDTVEFGEAVSYRLLVRNQSDGNLRQIMIVDTPPYGFRYMPSSATLDGALIADPQRVRLAATDGSAVSVEDAISQSDEIDIAGNGGIVSGLTFELPDLAPGQSHELVYRLQATALAQQGDGINTAVASAQTNSGVVISTAPAQAKVELRRTGVFSDRAILFGKVYVDSNCNYLQDEAEWPIAGVKLYLHDGSFVVSDEDGQFSFYGLRPGLHVLKIDPLTLPKGLLLKPLDNRQAADPDSRFVELSSGDFHRADFAAYCPAVDTDGVFERIQARNKQLRGAWLLDEASLFDPDGERRQSSDLLRAGSDGDISSGFIGDEKRRRADADQHQSRGLSENSNSLRLEADVLPQASSTLSQVPPGSFKQESVDADQASVHDPASYLQVGVDGRPIMGDPKEIAADITAAQALEGTWLWPADDFSTDGRFMAVVRAGLEPTLYVNGIEVSQSQIGERIVNRRENAQIIAWYGVRLEPGVNKVAVRATDSFGNVRDLAVKEFKRPAAGVRILLRTRQDTLPADGGRTMLPIDIVINDRNGYPASGVYFVTLDTTAGDFLEPDLQASEPGIQVRIENGRGKVHIRSSELTGPVRVTARAGNMQAQLNLLQIAAARPLLAAGLIELGAQWGRVTRGADTRGVTANGSNSAAGSSSDIEDGFDLDARAAVFIKGRVKRDMTLTLAYDSDKEKPTELLRDLNPNEYYPSNGDSSIRGYEAQSRSKLYVKLERDRNSIMWGDYLTDSHEASDNLARVQRTLTGLNGIYDQGKDRVQLFAARQSDTRTSEEIPGNGTSMLFRLAGAPLVANSEVVERIVRDRDNPGLIIDTIRLQPYADYQLDSQTGLMTFADVIPTVDADFNPVFVRISYDRSSDAEDYTVAGLRWQRQVSEATAIGISLTDDSNPIAGYLIAGVHLNSRPGINTSLLASSAVMQHRDGRNDGHGDRVAVEHFWSGNRSHRSLMSWARSNENFDNVDAGIAAGREEWRLEHHQPLSSSLVARGVVVHSESAADGRRFGSAELSLNKRYRDWTLTAGSRYAWSRDADGRVSFTTLLAGAERRWQLANGRSFSLGAEYERDVTDSARHRLSLNSRLQLHDHVSAYGRYEKERGISLTGSDGGAQRLIVGIESDVLPSTEIYSEYRLRGAYSGRAMETASGIRGRYELRPGLSFSPALELIDVLRGDNDDSTALSLGLSDTRNPNRKLTAQAEVRDTSSNRYYGFRSSLAQRLDIDWTVLLREEFTRQTPDTGELSSRHRFTLGLARRPKLNNRHHLLFLANWNQDYGPEDGQDRKTYLLSTHQNRTIGDQLTISGRLANKWQTTSFYTGRSTTRATLADVRATYDLDRRWEVDLRAGWLGLGRGGGDQYSAGAGLSWIAKRNLRLGISYNVIGFRERDLDEQGYNAKGLKLGLELKFDEDWFQWLNN